jgi:hypothetical protein
MKNMVKLGRKHFTFSAEKMHAKSMLSVLKASIFFNMASTICIHWENDENRWMEILTLGLLSSEPDISLTLGHGQMSHYISCQVMDSNFIIYSFFLIPQGCVSFHMNSNINVKLPGTKLKSAWYLVSTISTHK